MRPVKFQAGFIKDDFSRLCECVQNRSFLYTGVMPAVGQSTETQLSFDNGSWCRMSGVVTEVGPIPTEKTWMNTTMYLGCIEKDCVVQCHPEVFTSHHHRQDGLSADSMMKDLFVRDGCLNGQRLISYAVLNFNFFGEREYYLPVRKHRIYRIEYLVHDMMFHMWVVDKVIDVTNELPHPDVFVEWKEYWEHPAPTTLAKKNVLTKLEE